MSERKFRAGYTLLEVIIGLFIVSAAAVVAGQMFRLSLRTSEFVRDEGIARLLCERRLAAIRDWAAERDGATYRYNVWDESGPPFSEAADEDDARFRLSATSVPYPLYSPARGLRDAVAMTASARAVKVTARWGSDIGAMRARTLSLVGLVTEPPRRVTSVNVTPSSAALAAGADVTLQAAGSDGGGPIGDLVFLFVPLPGSGNLTVKTLLPPDRATIVNSVTYPSGRTFCTGGRCPIRVTARSDGRDFSDVPITIELGSPGGPL